MNYFERMRGRSDFQARLHSEHRERCGADGRLYEPRIAREDSHGGSNLVLQLLEESSLDEGLAQCAQKVGEEALEVAIAALVRDGTELKEEATDLLFHFLMLLEAKRVNLVEIMETPEKRHYASSKGSKESFPAILRPFRDVPH